MKKGAQRFALMFLQFLVSSILLIENANSDQTKPVQELCSMLEREIPNCPILGLDDVSACIRSFLSIKENKCSEEIQQKLVSQIASSLAAYKMGRVPSNPQAPNKDLADYYSKLDSILNILDSIKADKNCNETMAFWSAVTPVLAMANPLAGALSGASISIGVRIQRLFQKTKQSNFSEKWQACLANQVALEARSLSCQGWASVVYKKNNQTPKDLIEQTPNKVTDSKTYELLLAQGFFENRMSNYLEIKSAPDGLAKTPYGSTDDEGIGLNHASIDLYKHFDCAHPGQVAKENYIRQNKSNLNDDKNEELVQMENRPVIDDRSKTKKYYCDRIREIIDNLEIFKNTEVSQRAPLLTKMKDLSEKMKGFKTWISDPFSSPSGDEGTVIISATYEYLTRNPIEFDKHLFLTSELYTSAEERCANLNEVSKVSDADFCKTTVCIWGLGIDSEFDETWAKPTYNGMYGDPFLPTVLASKMCQSSESKALKRLKKCQDKFQNLKTFSCDLQCASRDVERYVFHSLSKKYRQIKTGKSPQAK